MAHRPALWTTPETCGVPTFLVLSMTCDRVWSRPSIHHVGGACVTESTSVLTDPATCGILNSELTNCPRTAAVLGGFAAQWQQMMGFLQRVEQETVSSQSVANAVENMNKTWIDATDCS